MRITSPLGRTGMPGRIRIVAQVAADDGRALGPVTFFVDQQLFRTDSDGPPYAVEWADENPFERREIAAEVTDALGRDGRAITSSWSRSRSSRSRRSRACWSKPRCRTRTGRFVKGSSRRASRVREDGVPQKLDLARQEAVGATFSLLLIDSSASMSRRIDFVQRTAATLVAATCRRSIGWSSRRFAKSLLPITGPTDDRQTIARGHRRDSPRRRHRDPRLAGRDARAALPEPRGGAR